DSGLVETGDLPMVLREAGRRAWVRVVLGPTRHRTAPAYYAQVVIGRQPPAWKRTMWRYSACTFAAAETSTVRLAHALDAAQPVAIKLGTVRVSFALMRGV